MTDSQEPPTPRVGDTYIAKTGARFEGTVSGVAVITEDGELELHLLSDKTNGPGEVRPVETAKPPQIINTRDLEGEASLAREMERPENQAKILDILEARYRRPPDPPQYMPGPFHVHNISDTARAIMAAALRQIADALSSGAPYVGGGVACEMDDYNVVTMRSDLKVQLPITPGEWKTTPDGKGIMRDPPLAP